VAIEHAGMFGALVESEERFRRAFEDNAVGMALTDLPGVLTKVNKALRIMLGLGEFELLGRPLTDLVHPDDRAAAAAATEEIFATPCTDLYGRTNPIGSVVIGHLSHAGRHLGMIEALRGLRGRGTATI